MMKQFYINKFLLILFFVLILANAQEPRQNTLVPENANAVLYLNTKQAEREMDAALWRTIQEDKNKAIDSGASALFFNMKNRDLEAALEFYLDHNKPLAFHIKCLADISGDIDKDMEKLKELMVDDEHLKLIERKQEEKTFYSILPKEQGNMMPWELSLAKEGNKVALAFYHNWQKSSGNIEDKISVTVDKRDFGFLQNHSFQENSFIFWGNVKRLAPMFKNGGFSDKKVLQMLDTLENVYLTGKVRGRQLMLHAKAKTVNTSVAKKYEEQLQPLAEKLSADGQSMTFISGFLAKASSASLEISFSIDLLPLWSYLSKVSSELPPSNDDDDDDDGDDDDGDDNDDK